MCFDNRKLKMSHGFVFRLIGTKHNKCFKKGVCKNIFLSYFKEILSGKLFKSRIRLFTELITFIYFRFEMTVSKLHLRN